MVLKVSVLRDLILVEEVRESFFEEVILELKLAGRSETKRGWETFLGKGTSC